VIDIRHAIVAELRYLLLLLGDRLSPLGDIAMASAD
jgi:hypothetical protein